MPSSVDSPILSMSFVQSPHRLLWLLTDTTVSILDLEATSTPNTFLSTWPHQRHAKEHLSITSLPGEISVSSSASTVFSAVLWGESGLVEMFSTSIDAASPHSISAETSSPSFSLLAKQCVWPPAITCDVTTHENGADHVIIILLGLDQSSDVWLQRFAFKRAESTRDSNVLGTVTKSIVAPPSRARERCRRLLVDFSKAYEGKLMLPLEPCLT